MTDSVRGRSGERRASAILLRYAACAGLGAVFGLTLGNAAVGLCLGFGAFLISGGEAQGAGETPAG